MKQRRPEKLVWNPERKKKYCSKCKGEILEGEIALHRGKHRLCEKCADEWEHLKHRVFNFSFDRFLTGAEETLFSPGSDFIPEG